MYNNIKYKMDAQKHGIKYQQNCSFDIKNDMRWKHCVGTEKNDVSWYQTLSSMELSYYRSNKWKILQFFFTSLVLNAYGRKNAHIIFQTCHRVLSKSLCMYIDTAWEWEHKQAKKCHHFQHCFYYTAFVSHE